MQDRDRLAPVPLAGEEPVAQAIGDLRFPGAATLEPGNHRLPGSGDAQAVQEPGVHHPPIALVGGQLHIALAIDDRDDWKIECAGKRVVTTVVSGYPHRCTSAIVD